MTDDIPMHMKKMGHLVVHLQSLEFALRAFLYNRESISKQQGPPAFLENIKEGDCVEVNAFTNYDTLGELIRKYNEMVALTHPALCVDKNIVDIRDALAHGRIASTSPSPQAPQKLVKYAKPKDGQVHVTHCFTLTKDWFDKQIKLVLENILHIQKANENNNA
ncbi:MAG: hypothetical protein MUO27_07300 [Sedimentisphaerales bacterium]|nr:hypothetical protein [Sedimentisphaerales bacterium]